MLFEDRAHGGRVLAERLERYRRSADVVVLGLPRGGIPVAYEVARALEAPLDFFLVRKLGAPGNEELAMGAIATGGVCILNDDVVAHLGIPPERIEAAVEREARRLQEQERIYRADRPPLDVTGRIAILVDDGLATGASMRAAAAALRHRHPAWIVAAAPVAAAETCRELAARVDEVVAAETPRHFSAVSRWYRTFPQTSDEEVARLLEFAARERRALPQ